MKIIGRMLLMVLVLLFLGWRLLPAQTPDNTVPPAKQAIEEQYRQEREEGRLNPAPSDPNTPLPKVHESTVKLGVFRWCDAYPSMTFHTVNCWQGMVDGMETVIYAGAQGMGVDSAGNEFQEPNPQQGVLVVDSGERRTGFLTGFLPTPERVGAVNIVAERDGILILVSETGRTYAFDVTAETFTPIEKFKCPRPQGFWKNETALWPVDSLTLGNEVYSQEELLNLLETPVGSQGEADASLILAHQLIPTKLSISDGSDPAPINKSLQDADGLLLQFYNDKDKLPFKVSPSSANGQAMVNDASALERYNNPLVIDSVTADPRELQAQRGLVPVSLTVSVTDACDANTACKIISVASRDGEDDDDHGDHHGDDHENHRDQRGDDHGDHHGDDHGDHHGDHRGDHHRDDPDWVITGDLTLKLRAKGEHVYVITVRCTDHSGNDATRDVTVKVRSDRDED
jgi:hypothetical protein